MVNLRNLVKVEDLDDGLKDEVRAECAKFGTIASVKVNFEPTVQGEKEVVVAVEFEASAAAATCATSMNKRWFGGRIVLAELKSS